MSRPKNTDTEKTREVIHVSVSPEEKRKIQVKAFKDYGLSVSEFGRNRLLMDDKESEASQTQNNLSNADEEVFKEIINELREEISNLKNENQELQLAKGGNEPNENVLIANLEPEFIDLINRIKMFREEKYSQLEDEEKEKFMPIEQYFKTIFLRGLKRSWNNSVLNSHTGIGLEDIKAVSEAAKIDYYEEI